MTGREAGMTKRGRKRDGKGGMYETNDNIIGFFSVVMRIVIMD